MSFSGQTEGTEVLTYSLWAGAWPWHSGRLQLAGADEVVSHSQSPSCRGSELEAAEVKLAVPHPQKVHDWPRSQQGRLSLPRAWASALLASARMP